MNEQQKASFWLKDSEDLKPDQKAVLAKAASGTPLTPHEQQVLEETKAYIDQSGLEYVQNNPERASELSSEVLNRTAKKRGS